VPPAEAVTISTAAGHSVKPPLEVMLAKEVLPGYVFPIFVYSVAERMVLLKKQVLGMLSEVNADVGQTCLIIGVLNV